MKNVYDNKKNAGNLILSIAKRINEAEGRARNYGTDTPLFNAEIHLIKAIKENDGIHVTALAEMNGVTKGSVSEIARKLEKKGMLTKRADKKNLSRFQLYLTEKGETAYRNHEKLHSLYSQAVERVMNEESEKERERLMKFLLEIDKALSEIGE